ncbi:MAG: cytochrome c maturation protein CcmE [Candidatus Thalassarchaeaceae archaeon]
MNTTRRSRLLFVGAIMIGLIALMFLSVDPQVQYTVDEVMDSPEEFSSDELNIRGVVKIQSIDNSSSTFILQGSEAQIEVSFVMIAVPDGFEEGRMIAVNGNLIQEGDIWKIDAKEIQTGCPSKYETE